MAIAAKFYSMTQRDTFLGEIRDVPGVLRFLATASQDPGIRRIASAVGVAILGAVASFAGLPGVGAVVALGGAAWLAWEGLAACGRESFLSSENGRDECLLAVAPAVAIRDGAGRWIVSPRMKELLGSDPLAAFAESGGEPLAAAWAGLEERGTAFAIDLPLAGRRVRVEGLRRDGVAVLLADADDARWAELERCRADGESARREAAGWTAVFDALPLPLWLRDERGRLLRCNPAFARAVETDPETAVREQRDLRGDGREGNRVSVAIGGERRLLDLSEARLEGGIPGATVLGYALDRTEVEEMRGELRRHLTAHAEVLERLNTAIAIFGPDTRMTFFNQAYARLWGLDEGWLHSDPTHGELLEELRAHRRLPETADFKTFKTERLALYTRLIEPLDELMHLPDGTTLRMLATPHPLGGLIIVQEDVTNTLALESSFNTLMAVQEETLDSLTEGIAVFGGDGRLKFSNPAFAQLWELGEEALQGEPHIVDVVERLQGFFVGEESDGGWSVLREEMISATLDRAVRSARLERSDGSVVEFSTLPLSDGAVLNRYQDVTDSSRLQEALMASNAALESAEELKGEFISNISHHLRTPLNGIIGFAEVLANQYFGPLNPRQMEYVRGVVNAGGRLLEVIDDIADLSNVGASVSGLERAPVPFANVVETVASLTREWARSEGVRLEVLMEPGIGIIDGDARRLKQAIFTLVVSALRTAPRDGRVVLAVERTGDSVVLSVGDTASPGNSGVFRYRSVAAESLGLTLVRNVIELHGGDMQVDGMPGRVTRVRCALPLADAQTVDGEPQG